MTRVEPHADWVIYLVVGGMVAMMMLGKYMMFKSDKKSKDDKPKDN